MRFIHTKTKSVKTDGMIEQSRLRTNKVVTASHICVVIGFSVIQALSLFNGTHIDPWRRQSAFFFFGGLADLFLSVMIWFILDDESTPTIYLDGNKVYPVLDVIC